MDTSQERERAIHASQKAAAIAGRLEPGKNDETKLCTEYRSYVDALPALILQSGIGQALATEMASGGMRAQGESAHHILFDHVAEWLCNERSGVFPGSKDLIASIMAGTEAEYIHAQSEALAWLTWHKKFCRAVLPKPSSESQSIAESN